MGSHPINLAVRFLLELTALISASLWGWRQGDGLLQYILAIGMPVVLAIIWGTFNVPNDPSRSGKAPVKTPGIIRLIIELGIFLFASWCLFNLQHLNFCIGFTVVVIGHYIVSYDRIKWLLTK